MKFKIIIMRGRRKSEWNIFYNGFGAAGQGTAVGVGSSPSGPGGMGGMAHGGRVGRRDRAPHVVVVVPHMGALMLAGMRR